jgi:Arc/MetJ-type ribon-helix-helix transcriptional regulator
MGLQRCIANRYANRMVQVVTRMEDELADAVDELVAAGVVASRSDAVRLGLRQLVDRYRREQIASRIVDGYRRHPQTEADVGWADESTVQMIADESW